VTDPLTILFFPESAYGPTNNCVGIGERLLRAGHRVVFATERSWEGRLTLFGFEERLVDLAEPPPEAGPADAGAFWKDFIKATASEFRKTAVEQLGSFMVPTWQALIDGARYCEGSLRDLCAEVGPDVIVEDNVVCFPALLTAGAAFARIVSCNPLEIRGTGVPPPYAGLPSADRSQWSLVTAEYERTHRFMWREFDSWVQAQGAPGLPYLEFIRPSDELNLYVYPEVLDYDRSRSLDRSWQRLESSVRSTDDDLELPASVTERPEGTDVIYLSLGSLGSADVELMKRLVDALSESPHRVVVSKGPQHASYDLPENMWGAEFLPQTRVLPHVDLVISHGGNNTVTESVHFGKPMIVLPLFWDQHDNARRVEEQGVGLRFAPYAVTAQELNSAVDRLLQDRTLRSRLAGVGSAVRAADGAGVAAKRIAEIGWRRRQSVPPE
jgi:MGT family glycosyltransferase